MPDTGNNIRTRIKRFIRMFFSSLGIFFLLLVVIAFTRLPYDVQQWLGTHKSGYKFYPDEIVLLGGSGMPSESNLMRIYYASALSNKYPQSRVLIVHPIDEMVISKIKDELVLRGIDSTKIDVEAEGTNTHDQAVQVAGNFPHLLNKHILLVTSTESMLRTVYAFRKAGFESVGGHSAFETAMFVNLGYDFKKSGGKIYSPDVSDNLALRYNFWNYLKLEISCLREFAALGYYWLNGWI